MVDPRGSKLYELHVREWDFENLLKRSLKELQDSWRAFEALLLEQAVLSRLFELGFVIELGACASVSSIICNGISDCSSLLTTNTLITKRMCHNANSTLVIRTDFKKCAGRASALYCSRSCQSIDWRRHRVECKKLTGNLVR